MAALTSSVYDLVDRIAAADTVSGVWDAYLASSREVGLEFGVAAHLPTSKTSEIYVIANALPGKWLEEYYSDGLEAGDLLVSRIRNSTASFEWRMTDWNNEALTPIQQQWYAHNIAYGFYGGLCILDFRPTENILMLICGQDCGLQPHDRMTLLFAGQEAIMRLRELSIAAPMPHTSLSQRERECLQWAAAGKTDWEIGRILSLSEKTVNVYIGRAKAKFGVKTRAQAVVLALQQGFIAA